LFRHFGPDDPRVTRRSPAEASGSADLEATLGHFSELPLAQRAAEVLEGFATLSQDSVPSMDDLLSHWLPGVTSLDSGFQPPPSPDQISWDQQAIWYEVRRVLEATIQALELSRLICRSESTTNHLGTVTGYTITADGTSALQRSDVADVVTRRLPD
jgi:hypothetical protein